MLTINEFQREIEKHFADYLKPAFQDVKIQIFPAHRTNCVKSGIRLIPKQTYNGAIPLIYLEDMYEHYLDNGNLNDTFTAFAMFVKNCPRHMEDYSAVFTSEYILDHVFIQLINRKKNEALLTQIPHADFLDLAAVFRVRVDLDGDKQYTSYLLTYEIMKLCHLDLITITRKAYSFGIAHFGQRKPAPYQIPIEYSVNLIFVQMTASPVFPALLSHCKLNLIFVPAGSLSKLQGSFFD